MTTRSDSRRRMIASTIALLREQGLTGTSFGDVLEHSGAPRGSIYHHFPGGKTQLVEEAVQAAGRSVTTMLERAAGDDPVAAVRQIVAFWRSVLEDNGFRAGCPVVAVAIEAPDDDARLAETAAAVFAAWEDGLAEVLRRGGATPARARRLARMTVASIEGAVVLCRANRDTTALDDVARELETLLRDALA